MAAFLTELADKIRSIGTRKVALRTRYSWTLEREVNETGIGYGAATEERFQLVLTHSFIYRNPDERSNALETIVHMIRQEMYGDLLNELIEIELRAKARGEQETADAIRRVIERASSY